MNEEDPTPEQAVEAQLVAGRRNEAPSLETQLRDSRHRLRELLAIPDRDRTDAIWDEIIVLEIQLAPGNRASSPHADIGRRQEPARHPEPGRRPEQMRRKDPASSRARRFHQKPERGPGTPTTR